MFEAVVVVQEYKLNFRLECYERSINDKAEFRTGMRFTTRTLLNGLSSLNPNAVLPITSCSESVVILYISLLYSFHDTRPSHFCWMPCNAPLPTSPPSLFTLLSTFTNLETGQHPEDYDDKGQQNTYLSIPSFSSFSGVVKVRRKLPHFSDPKFLPMAIQTPP